MKTRVLSGMILAPLLIIVYLGGWPLAIGSMLIAAVGILEFFGGFSKLDIHPSRGIAFASGAALYAIVLTGTQERFLSPWLFVTVVLCLLFLFAIERRSLADGMATLTGIVYVIYFTLHVVMIDRLPSDAHLIWLVFLAAFGTDSIAYFSGYLFGRHKLCPSISPKKTIEGAVGGTLGSVILCSIFGALFAEGLVAHCAVIGLAGSIVAQLGDLTASIFKRKMGIKDYGNLIPGHGGILDRFDSILFTAPFVYYYILLVIA